MKYHSVMTLSFPYNPKKIRYKWIIPKKKTVDIIEVMDSQKV